MIPRTALRSTCGMICLWLGGMTFPPSIVSAQDESWSCEILPPEHEIVIDPINGVKTVFVTNNPASDTNLYFHDRSWLADESMLVFHSDRSGRNELLGYLEATGQLVRIVPSGSDPIQAVTCARKSNMIYGIRGNTIVALRVEVSTGATTHVNVTQHKIAPVPENGSLRSSLNENCEGRLLSLGFVDPKDPSIHHIAAIEIETGALAPIAAVKHPVSHVQWSWTRPDLIMYALYYPEGDRMAEPKVPDEPPHYRIWHVDRSGREPWPIHAQKPEELVTHECWWTEDRLTFCGAYHSYESHLKIYDLKTRRISILGAGNWWPEGTDVQIKRRAWWHAAGSPDGRWVAADTSHGDVVLFDATTTEEYELAKGHRTYGTQEAHPHVGWAPSSNRVVFASNKRGNPDVVIGYVPKDWNTPSPNETAPR